MAPKREKKSGDSNQTATEKKRAQTHWGVLLAALLVVLSIALLAGRWSLSSYCLNTARGRMDRFEYHDAIKCLTFAENWQVDSAESHFLKARIYRKTGKFADFEKAIAESQRRGLDKSRAANEKLLLEGQSGNIDKLMGKLEQLVGGVNQFDPTEVYEALVNGFLLHGRHDEAAEYLKNWKKDFPDDPSQKYYQATLLLRYGDALGIDNAIDQAEQLLKELALKFPKHYAALIAYGGILFNSDRVEEAIRLLENCVEDPDATAEPKAFLAQCYAQAGKKDLAQEIFSAILKEDPDHITALAELGKIQFENGEIDEALTSLNAAFPRRHWDYELASALARSLQHVGRSAEARPVLERANQLQAKQREIEALKKEVAVTRNEESRFRLGKMLLEFGDPSEGLFYLQSVVQANPGHQAARQTLNEYFAHRSQTTSNIRLTQPATPGKNQNSNTPKSP